MKNKLSIESRLGKVGKTFCTLGKVLSVLGALVIVLSIIINMFLMPNALGTSSFWAYLIPYMVSGAISLMASITLYISGCLFLGFERLLLNTAKTNDLLENQT